MNENTSVEVLITFPFPEPLVDELRAISPRLRITAISARRPEDVPADVWNRSEILYTDRALPEPDQTASLKWVQFHYAGIDFMVNAPALQKPGLHITTLSGASAPQMAEYAVMMMLALGHRMPDLAVCQTRTEWPNNRWERFAPHELRGSTVGLVGYGSIGREIARLLQPFGVTILAAKRDVLHPEDHGYTLPGLGDPNGDLFTRLYPIQAVRSLMRESDYVVISLPLTPETRGLIKEDDLAAMKPTAFLIDFGRGGVIDPAALLLALQEKRFAGAALDVFPEEPLPPSSPLWRLPNVLITPHISGISLNYKERAAQMFAENIRRYLAGESLLNRFDLARGY